VLMFVLICVAGLTYSARIFKIIYSHIQVYKSTKQYKKFKEVMR
jgi:hypothetical protein